MISTQKHYSGNICRNKRLLRIQHRIDGNAESMS